MDELLLKEVAAFKANRNRLMGRLLTKSYRYMSDLAREYLEGIGYTTFRVGHVVALVSIDLDGININRLAVAAGMTKQGMSKLIKELEEEGFVCVEKDKTDARALVVKHTDKGLQAMVDWKNCTEYINQEFRKVLGEEKLEHLKDILGVLVNHYEECNIGSVSHPMLKFNILAKR